MSEVRKGFWFTAFALILLAAALAPSSQAADRRMVVEMDEPFEIDGVLYPASELSLREVTAYSPIASIAEVRVNGRSLGMLLAKNGDNPTPAKSDELIFQRGERGHLVLVSVARKGEPTRELYRLAEPGSEPQLLAATIGRSPAMVASK